MLELIGSRKAVSPSPLAAATAERTLGRRLARNGTPLCVAFSGGGDSTALLLLALTWAKPAGRPVIALTVDHGLNPQSGVWTRRAGEAARDLGARWRSLSWTGTKPTTGVQEAARQARHKLLADAARALSANVILFGHTFDDVLEEEILRSTDAPGIGRLKDWSPSPVWPEGRGLFILRPLLEMRRDDLRRALDAAGVRWFDDPANEDQRFARVRARSVLAACRASGVDAGAGFRPEAPDAGPADFAVVRAATSRYDGAGALQFPRDLLSASGGHARRLIATAAVCASGAAAPPRSDAVERLRLRLLSEHRFSATLAGARVVAAEDVVFMREPGELKRRPLEKLNLRAGVSAVWDGRFELLAEAPAQVIPLAGVAGRLRDEERLSLRNLPPPLRSALPVLETPEGLSLPRPFGEGGAFAHALARDRFASAWGLIGHESDISHGAIA